MLSISMGEYTLDSIATMPISPKSYGRPTCKMKSQESTMTVFDTFVPSSIPLEAEKEEQVVKDWIYRGEEDYTTSITTPISPMRYGKGYSLLQRMGYQGKGPLSNNGHALVEPLSHTNGRPSKDTTGLGYGTQEAIPKCSNGSPSLSDSDSDTNQSFTHCRLPAVMVDDVIPSTSLLWGEESSSSDPLVPTSQDLHEDSFRGR